MLSVGMCSFICVRDVEFHDFLLFSGFLFQIFTELMLDLLHPWVVLVEDHMLIRHRYTVACQMNCSLRYCISGHDFFSFQ